MKTFLSAIVVTLIATVPAWGQDDTPRKLRKKPTAERPAEFEHYWIGIWGVPVEGALKTHLRLDHGVLVTHVADDGPAAKAGLQENDIILKFGDKAVAKLSEIADAIAANKDQKVTLTVLHAGQETTLTVQPEKSERPAIGPREADQARIRKWMDQLGRGEFGRDPLRMFFMRPGIIMPDGGKLLDFRFDGGSPDMPKHLSITVTKQGGEPAKITVKSGDKTWEVTEDTLKNLPDDIRPHVERYLGRGFHIGPRPGDFGEPMPPFSPEEFRRRFEGFRGGPFEDLRKEMDKLRKELDELRKERQGAPPAEKPRVET